MRISDEQIVQYYELATIVPNEQIDAVKSRLDKGENPRDVKADLAKEIVTLYHGKDAAKGALEAFDSQFRDGNLPDDIPIKKLGKIDWQLADLLVYTELAPSKTEAKRLVEQGAVRLNQEKIDSEEVTIKDADILQAGKHRFAKLSIQDLN